MSPRKHARVGEKNQPDEGLVFGVGGGMETSIKSLYINALGAVRTVSESYIKLLYGYYFIKNLLVLFGDPLNNCELRPYCDFRI
jgi:hypothetical protein